MILLDVFHISFVLFSMEDISKETPLKLALKTPNVQTPGAVTTSARCPFQPDVLTCTMLPQFPLVLLIWKEMKSSPSMWEHCLSLILTPSLSKPSWKSLHLDMDTSIWDALQVTSASMMSWESAGKGYDERQVRGSWWCCGGWGGEASHDCFLEKRLMIFSQRLGISNEALIQPYEYMKSFKAVTGMLLSFLKKKMDLIKCVLSFLPKPRTLPYFGGSYFPVSCASHLAYPRGAKGCAPVRAAAGRPLLEPPWIPRHLLEDFWHD